MYVACICVDGYGYVIMYDFICVCVHAHMYVVGKWVGGMVFICVCCRGNVCMHAYICAYFLCSVHMYVFCICVWYVCVQCV